MGLINVLKSLDKRVSWGPVGIIVGIVIGFPALYTTLHEKKPSISYHIINEANVFSLHKQLEDLTITFQGEDVQKRHLNLRLTNLRVVNDGEVDILQNLYEEGGIWGVQVGTGKIIEARVVKTASEYIEQNINIKLTNERTVSFEKIIFEREKYFDIELLILHKKGEDVELKATGKIAGIELIPVKTLIQKEKVNFWEEVFKGNYLVHIIRALIYLLLFVLCIVMVAFPSSQYSDWKRERKIKRRRKVMEKILGIDIEDESDRFHQIYTRYLMDGLEYLERLKRVLSDQNWLIEYIPRHQIQSEYNNKIAELGSQEEKMQKSLKDIKSFKEDQNDHHFIRYFDEISRHSRSNMIDELLDKDLIQNKEGKITIDSELEFLIENLEKLEKIKRI